MALKCIERSLELTWVPDIVLIGEGQDIGVSGFTGHEEVGDEANVLAPNDCDREC